MQAPTHLQPPQILEIVRELLKHGSELEYGKIEENNAQLAVELGCPHPYLGIESLTGPEEVWWLNGYASADDLKQVADNYAKNTRLLGAFKANIQRKASLVGEAIEVFTHFRPELTTGAPWILGQGRFLVITVIKDDRQGNGTVFDRVNLYDQYRTAREGTEAEGKRFVFKPAATREEAEAIAATEGPESRVFAVRASWGFPAKEWVAGDPSFWGPRHGHH